MNRDELKLKLDELGISSSDYSLDGTLRPMCAILFFEDPKWLTFEYDEHGHVLDKKQFDTEDQACRNMVARMIELKEFREKYNLE